MVRVIKVFEFEKLSIHPDELGRSISKQELECLYQFNDQHDNIYFTGIRDGIKFKNYVGVIQVGRLVIEILPKTDINAKNEDDYHLWHNVLINLLRVCKFLNVSSLTEANLKSSQNSILDLYFTMFLDEVELILRKGLIKNYRRNRGNLHNLKGKINFTRNIQKNLIRKDRFYTEHQVYDYEHLLNQILLEALNILKNLNTYSSINLRIERILIEFPDIKGRKISLNDFDRLELNRKSSQYSKALQIAKMIILNYSPDIRTGQENMLALLFDMNKLWEEYIYRMLIRAKPNNYDISYQNRQKFWEHRTIKPDLVIKHQIDDQQFTYVIDTKWKVLDQNNPIPSDNDLKQMYSYNMYWDANKSMLLYPGTKINDEKFGVFWKGKAEISNNKCKLGFVNILNPENILDYSIGTKILAKFAE